MVIAINTLVMDANKDLSASQKSAVEEIELVLDQARDKFRGLRIPSEVGALKSIRDQIQQLNLSVTYQSK